MAKRNLQRYVIPVIFPALLLLLGADDDVPQPTSPDAVAVIKKHDRTIDDAQRVFDQAKKKADADAIRQLKSIERDTMRAGNLTEADAIDAKCKSLSEGDVAGDARAILGTWAIGNNKWAITATAIKHPDGHIAKPTFEGPSCMVEWASGWIDRFTILNGGLLLHEAWSHGHRMGSDVPDIVEEGKRAEQ